MNIVTKQQEQSNRTTLSKHIIGAVLEANPSKGYNNPTTIAGCIFNTLVTNYMHGRSTPMADLVTLHENMSPFGTLEGTTLHSIKRVSQYLATIAAALEAGDEPCVELVVWSCREGYEVTFR